MVRFSVSVRVRGRLSVSVRLGLVDSTTHRPGVGVGY